MGAQPTPGLFEGVEDLVLGDGLIDAALEDALSAAAGEGDRFVRREQRDVRPLQFPLDRQPLEGRTYQRPPPRVGLSAASYTVAPVRSGSSTAPPRSLLRPSVGVVSGSLPGVMSATTGAVRIFECAI